MKSLARTMAATAVIALALAGSSQAGAVPGGRIDTLPTGRFQCERPGGPSGMDRIRVSEEDFRAVTASSYVVAGVRGTYLLTGDSLVMTSGPFKGKRYHRTSYGYLRPMLPDGSEGEMRCVLMSER